CPPRLAAAVERALAKSPADRFPSMDAFAAELDAIRRLLDAAGEETAETLAPVSRRPPRRRPRRALRMLLVLVTVAALAGTGVAVYALHGGSGPKRTAAAAGSPVELQGVGAYDPPPGDGQEHGEDARLATDGNAATFWRTEHYRDGLNKPGVGLVLGAATPVELTHLTVTTDTPGFTA